MATRLREYLVEATVLRRDTATFRVEASSEDQAEQLVRLGMFNPNEVESETPDAHPEYQFPQCRGEA